MRLILRACGPILADGTGRDRRWSSERDPGIDPVLAVRWSAGPPTRTRSARSPV